MYFTFHKSGHDRVEKKFKTDRNRKNFFQNPIVNGIENRKMFPENLSSFRREIEFCFRKIARKKIPARPQSVCKIFKTDRNRFEKKSKPIMIDVEKS